MISAKMLSDRIRSKRKKVASDGVENMVDTAPGPQMNPQDILNLKQQAQMDDTLDLPAKSSAPSDPADANISGSSQEKSALMRHQSRVRKIIGRLSIG